jgi:Flp pilus assembly pilin Flp
MTQLHNARTRLQASARKQRGAASVEYAVLVGILLVCGFAMWRYFFRSVNESVQRSGNVIESVTGGDGTHAGSRQPGPALFSGCQGRLVSRFRRVWR